MADTMSGYLEFREELAHKLAEPNGIEWESLPLAKINFYRGQAQIAFDFFRVPVPTDG